MRHWKHRAGVLLPVLIAVVAAAQCAAADQVIDVYGGIADTSNTNVTAEKLFSSGPDQRATRNIDFGSSPIIGARFTFWFGQWFGAAIDASYFGAVGDGVENMTGALTPMVMLRMPLSRSKTTPTGRVQPYIGFGPGLFITDQEVHFDPDVTGRVDGFHVSLGVDFRVGLRWRITRAFGVLSEYRLTHFEASSSNDDNRVVNFETHIRETLTAHHFLAGVSLYF